jgi:hypothetical protein
MTSSQEGPIFVAFDIESTGPVLNAHIPAVGIAVGDPTTGRVIQTKLIKILPDPEKDPAPCPKCKAEFWDKNPGLWEKLQDKDALAPENGWFLVAACIDALYQTYGKRLQIWSDNPAFDIAHIDFKLWQFGVREYPIRYDDTLDGIPRYNGINDIDGYMAGLPKAIHSAIMKSAPAHTHSPDEDAAHILHQAMKYYQYKHLLLDKLST